MNAKGKFIVVEGLDGSGSTTQASLLASRLRKGGFRVFQTREPSDGPGGLLIRLSLAKRLSLDAKTRTFLFAADRVDHLFNKSTGIAPFLDDPRSVVVCERYLLSFLAYQSFDAEVSLDWLDVVSWQCVMPTLVIWLDVPVEECLRRIIANRGFHQELYETQEQLTVIAERFRMAAKHLQSQGFSIRTINGEGTNRQVADRIKVAVDSVSLPGRIPLAEWKRFFTRYPLIAKYAAEFEGAGLGVELRTIQAGVQIIVFDDLNLVQVNIFDSGKVYLQGSPGELRERVDSIMGNSRFVPFSVVQSTLFPDGGEQSP